MPVLETAAALASIVGAGAASVSAMKDAGDAMYHSRTVARVCTTFLKRVFRYQSHSAPINLANYSLAP